MSGNQNLIPGPLLRAQVGDRIVVHFKNMDFTRMNGHSMHFHGVEYKPSSDGASVPGVSGPDGNVLPGATWTYRSIRGRNEELPDREFVVVFAAMGDFQTIGGRAFVGNTPVFESRVGDLVQWDVMGMGSEHHTSTSAATAGWRPAASRATPTPSARRSPSASAGASATPAPGSITAMSSSTWSAG